MGTRLAGWYGREIVDGDVVAGSVKDLFRRDARRFLGAVGKVLVGLGWELGDLSFNAGGPAVSGDCHALYWSPGGHEGIYVMVSAGSHGWPWASVSRSGVSIMYRATTRSRPYSGGANKWDARWDMEAVALAHLLAEAVPGGGAQQPPVAVEEVPREGQLGLL